MRSAINGPTMGPSARRTTPIVGTLLVPWAHQRTDDGPAAGGAPARRLIRLVRVRVMGQDSTLAFSKVQVLKTAFHA